MDPSLLDAAIAAFQTILVPHRFMILAAGVVMGLGLGIIPGIGGLVGMAILLPFTFTMDPPTAFALLLGMTAVTGTSDTIPAVLFGVPGTASSQATIIDGNAMAKKGEAGRALSAAYTASLIGGLFGALILALSIPIIRPLIMLIGSPELLALSIFGISMVSTLSGKAPLRGIAVAGLGCMLSMIGADPQTGIYRWTFGQLYLWDGLPIVPFALGIFAIPELADLAIRRSSIADGEIADPRRGAVQGMRDALRNWSLVLRCGGIGAAVGAIPGLGSSVVDWIAYGHAIQTEKGARETFGTGDVRGVIAPESANNSITSGALIPTIAFGVPGSASMAILLGAFLIQGLIPGPAMLTTDVQMTFTMIWSIAIANILGAGICFAFSGQLAKLALLRYTVILPAVLIIVFIGAYQASRNWGDIWTLLIFSLVGWTMKRLGWARPPLVLGFVLGSLIERYMSISINRFGAEWLLRPAVVVLLLASAWMLVRPVLRNIREDGGLGHAVRRMGRPSPRVTDLFYLAFLALGVTMLWQAASWPFAARVAPMIVGVTMVTALLVSLVFQVLWRNPPAEAAGAAASGARTGGGIHMDVSGELAGLTRAEIARRGLIFLAWLLAVCALIETVGLIPTVPIFVIAYMRIEGRERWRLVLPLAAAMALFVWVVFDQVMLLPWPQTLLGHWFPALRVIPSV